MTRRSRRLAVAVALAATFAATAPVAAAVVTVTTAADVVNGDVTNPATLQATPGPDGVSLREAILAIHGAPGPHVIRFGAAVVGRTIRPSVGYVIRQRGVTIHGRLDAGGAPAVTIDAGMLSAGSVFLVRNSDFAFRRLRVVNVPPGRFALSVRAGLHFGDPGPRRLTSVEIRDNVFSVSPTLLDTGLAVSVGMDDAEDTVLDDVTVAHNTFRGFRGSEAVGVHVAAGGARNAIERVVIHGNVFDDVTFGVELVPAGAQDARIRRVRIVGNRFVGNEQPVNLNHIGSVTAMTTHSVIADTDIAGNTFRDNRGPDVVLTGGMTNAMNNLIATTRVVNNLMTGNGLYGGVSVGGGRRGGNANRIEGLFVVNNTIADNVGAGVDINPNLDGTSGNTVSGVVIRNVLFRDNTGGDVVFWNVPTPQVDHSLTTDVRFVGTNGNVAGDPHFVDAAAGDFRLGAGSAAIDAGSSVGTPARDFSCRTRVDDPGTANTGAGARPYYDIGAYEYRGRGPACAAKVTVVVSGAGTVESMPAGFVCRGTCATTLPLGTRLVLSARPDDGATFAGWGDECTRRGNCAITVAGETRVLARFTTP